MKRRVLARKFAILIVRKIMFTPQLLRSLNMNVPSVKMLILSLNTISLKSWTHCNVEISSRKISCISIVCWVGIHLNFVGIDLVVQFVTQDIILYCILMQVIFKLVLPVLLRRYLLIRSLLLQVHSRLITDLNQLLDRMLHFILELCWQLPRWNYRLMVAQS